MKPIPERQRRHAHRQRLALGRTLHQILTFKDRWFDAWRRGNKPRPIKLPRSMRKHKRMIYRAFMRP